MVVLAVATATPVVAAVLAVALAAVVAPAVVPAGRAATARATPVAPAVNQAAKLAAQKQGLQGFRPHLATPMSVALGIKRLTCRQQVGRIEMLARLEDA